MPERHRFYNGSAIQRRAPRFIGGERSQRMGKRKRYAIQFFVCEFNLTADQVNLDPSMDVGDNHTSLRLPLNMMVPARRAFHRR